MGAAERRKGLAWERTVARRLTEATGREHRRVLTETRDGNVGDVEGATPLTIQAKCMARPNVWKALDEARAAAGPGSHPVAVVKRTSASRRTEEVAVLPLEDFLEVVGLLCRLGCW